MLRLRNKIQCYAWGSRTWLSEFLGSESPSLEPQAELWMGAHSSAPSEVLKSDVWTPLTQLIDADAEPILGTAVLEKFGAHLPFLLKVLAAEQPLSLQVHPSSEQAKSGFQSEEARGIPLTAKDRSYKDVCHKPELLCALTPFIALCGFRPASESLALLRALEVPGLTAVLTALAEKPNAAGVKAAFSALMTADRETQRSLSRSTAEAAERLRERGSEFQTELEWTTRLAAIYPGDIGVVSALMLNLIELAPGEALYLPAGNLHAYLRGVGVEIMANSDNVIRGGLTMKHVDVSELLRIVDFEAQNISKLKPVTRGAALYYPTEAREFELSTLQVSGESKGFAERTGPEIILCVAGNVSLRSAETTLDLQRGESAFVSDNDPPYEIAGNGQVFRASLPKS